MRIVTFAAIAALALAAGACSEASQAQKTANAGSPVVANDVAAQAAADASNVTSIPGVTTDSGGNVATR